MRGAKSRNKQEYKSVIKYVVFQMYCSQFCPIEWSPLLSIAGTILMLQRLLRVDAK